MTHIPREKITSNNPKVLEQSLAFARQRASMEAERGKSAENRATAMLAILGILGGFIVPFVQPISAVAEDARWSLLSLFVGSLLFLAKGLYGAIRVLGVSRPYRLEIDTVFDFQQLSPEDALKEEIAGTVWECQKAIPSNSERLRWLDRCQRSGLIALMLFMALRVALFAAGEKWIALPSWVAGIIAAAMISLLVAADPIFESRGIWKRAIPAPAAAVGLPQDSPEGEGSANAKRSDGT